MIEVKNNDYELKTNNYWAKIRENEVRNHDQEETNSNNIYEVKIRENEVENHDYDLRLKCLHQRKSNDSRPREMR